MYLKKRMRRLRLNKNIRNMVEETKISTSDLILPLFVDENLKERREIIELPGHFRYPIDKVALGVEEAEELGIPAVILFGIPSKKDEIGSQAYAHNGVVQRSIRNIKEKSDILVISDICMCEYTSHGHCGILNNSRTDVDNDETLEYYKEISLSQVEAGSDMIAPSGMMDGMVAAIRDVLDSNGFSNIPIMSYSTKFASSFYGPFRFAADSAPSFGDRKAYQINPANKREAIEESLQDLEEGADILMVKPALPYLDIIHELRGKTNAPIATYQVSGEFAMIKAAAANGWIDEKKIMMETLISIKRAGADIIITYFAKEAASILNSDLWG